MLYGDERYIREFAEAAIASFTEFKENFALHLQERDETNLRKAGHKIKPVAQMLGIQPLLDEYEASKEMLWNKKKDAELKKSAETMVVLCDQVLSELKALLN